MVTDEGIHEAKEFVAHYSLKYHPPGKKRVFLNLHFAPCISDVLIDEARALYAFYNPEEETPLLLYREANHEVKGAGFLVTTKGFYYCLSFTNIYGACYNYYHLDDISFFELKVEGFFKGTKIFINGLPASIILGINKRQIKIVTEIMNELIRMNNQEKEAIRQKYDLGDKDPLMYITELYQSFIKGTLGEADFSQKKKELLRVI